MEIAPAGGQAAVYSLGPGIDLQVTVKMRHDNIVMLVLVPSGAVLDLRETPSCQEHKLNIDQHIANGAANFLAFTHSVSSLQLNSGDSGKPNRCKAGHHFSEELYCQQR